MLIKVLVFPKNSNPYQELLYKSIDKDKYITEYLENPTKSHIVGLLILPFQLLLKRLSGFKIFHIHFVYPFQLYINHKIFYSYPFRLVYTFYFYYFILLVRILGYKLVWTAHDIVPHGTHFINDIQASRYLASCCNAIIIHSKTSIEMMNNLGIKGDNATVIPIGNYVGLYKDSVTTSQARNKIKVNKKDFVYGYFGRVEYYKGVIELVDAFNELHLDNIKLVIAGPCQNSELKQFIESRAKSNRNIILDLHYISDDDVQMYMKSANIFVYPFRNITTTSSVILAMSFKRTVICPLIGDIINIPKELGYFYKPEENFLVPLTIKMTEAYKNQKQTESLGESSYRYVRKFDWEKITKKTEDLFVSLVRNDIT